jgi:hypothetical protein
MLVSGTWEGCVGLLGGRKGSPTRLFTTLDSRQKKYLRLCGRNYSLLTIDGSYQWVDLD